MRIRLLSLVALFVLVAAACQSGPPPTQIVLEVTRIVTQAPTETTETNEPEPTMEVTAEPAVETTADSDALSQAATTGTPPVTSSAATQLPENFPTPVVGQVYVAEQAFQNGRMFWLEPSDQIWILAEDDQGNQRWLVYNNTWNDTMPESDETIQPPEAGLQQPIRGFGKLWRENQNVRDLLGWAVDPEFGHVTRYEFHAGGSVNDDGEFISGPGYHLITALNGDVLKIEEASRTWTIVNN